jgi:hypothetical protein
MDAQQSADTLREVYEEPRHFIFIDARFIWLVPIGCVIKFFHVDRMAGPERKLPALRMVLKKMTSRYRSLPSPNRFG